MPSDPLATRRWLADIRHHIVVAQSFVADLDYDAFKDDLLRFHAVTRCLEIVSEASRRLPDELKARHPAIPWREWRLRETFTAMTYDYVAARRVWQTLQRDLPPLLEVVRIELAAVDFP